MGIKYYWEKYLNLEKDFIVAKRYVSFSVSNYAVSSDFFVNEIVLLGSLIETSLKYLATLKNPGCSLGNMGEIKGEILSNIPGIVSYETRMIDSNDSFKPFEGWDTGNLVWWDVYTKAKHGIITDSNIGIALKMLSAFEVVLFIIHAEQLRCGIIANADGDTAYVRYSFDEKPSLLFPKLEYNQMMGQGNYYFCFPVSQYL